MKTRYVIEALDEQGNWKTEIDTVSPIAVMRRAMELAGDQVSTRQSTLHGKDAARRDVVKAEVREFDRGELSRILGELAGAASTCWEDLNAAGVFDSTRAQMLVENALNEIGELIGGTTVESAPAERQGRRVPRIGDPVVYYQGSMKRIVPAVINELHRTIDPETDLPEVGLFIMWPGVEDPLPPSRRRPYSAELSSGCWSWPDAVPDAL
ncbi:hypothetical protein SEA_KING2_62 [Arthrobacter phage King2]|uniref:Uncharacterized protein n=1 Tax=Arthrobacter phage King2 TaxID=2762386 RepID=A0A7G8LQW0_9CAUD|nr:hypothetical protein SEA_KING2_62 [Arthrobacter phage King2]